MPQIPPETLVALALFALVSSITPGPNNAMLLASGANFGLRRTLPHMAGVSAGFFVVIVAAGLLLGGLFAAVPQLHGVLKVVGGAYLLYLAWKIATSKPAAGEAQARPQTFWQAAAFQWVNPKAVAMALSAVTTYAPAQGYAANVMLVAAVFTLINLPCIASWAGFGVALRGLLARPGWLKAFNWTMAALLVLSLVPAFLDGG
ncbi:MAG TPA: LysE family translocator [Phenylobacterium sp.]